MRFFKFFLLIFIVFISACADEREYFAPVEEISTIQPIPKSGVYRVAYNETLYSIAWRYGLDYRDLARRNQLQPPYAIQPGQVIYLKNYKPTHIPPRIVSTPAINVSTPVLAPPPIAVAPEPNWHVGAWWWPARGNVIRGFGGVNKGINIAGQAGDPIFATAPGRVVYSGNGIRGYGNLIIIKHNGEFLTAYAHNSQVFVREGQWIRQGQKIASMGNTGARRVMLHFEIRKGGKPVNPLVYLPKKAPL